MLVRHMATLVIRERIWAFLILRRKYACMFVRNSSAHALLPLKGEGRFPRIFPSDPAVVVGGKASW